MRMVDWEERDSCCWLAASPVVKMISFPQAKNSPPIITLTMSMSIAAITGLKPLLERFKPKAAVREDSPMEYKIS